MRRSLLVIFLVVLACVSALGLLLVTLVFGMFVYIDYSEHPESYYPTHEDAEAAGLFKRYGISQLAVPESATNIHARRNIDTNYVWTRFEFEASDEPDVPLEARNLEGEELRIVQVPEAPYGGHKWWDLSNENLDLIAERPGVVVYEVRKEDSFPREEERLGYLVVDRTKRVAHYFFGYHPEIVQELRRSERPEEARLRV